ncbi:heme-binding protein [Pantoea sp. SM3]|uniref:GlcG/HbpS family heme-binding protein n=1 Tax=Pantoea sp. SM3 TaxID=1628192 RepID=UPI0005F7FF77|nr:heme-binding protein [Pantoea sp. SM3]KJV35220.1 GlcG [Pantoea sp. SM3]
MTIRLSLIAAAAAFVSFGSQAAVTESNLSLAEAQKLASAAIQSCAAKNYNVTVTVVDRAGLVTAVQRMDNAGPHTVEASRMKAYTALSTKNLSGKVMETAQNNPGAQNMRDVPGFLLLAGGVPVKSGNQVIGAIGVGGAPGGNLDEACALDALKAIE